MVTLGKPRGLKARVADMVGVRPEPAKTKDLRSELDAAQARVAELETALAGARARALLWKACAKMLRERLATAHVMLNRLRARAGDSQARLVGGPDDMRRRLGIEVRS